MKNIFDTENYKEIMSRIDKLSPQSQAAWGKMNVSQMLAHCSGVVQMALGEIKLKVPFIFKIIGPLFKSAITNEKPFKRNSPTAPEFVMVSSQKEFETEKERLKSLVSKLHNTRDGFEGRRHPFFGKMTKDDWANSAYKHLDHHLRQFGV